MSDPTMVSVQVWDRQRAAFREEPIYRRGTLQFLFHHPLGRFFMRHIMPNRSNNKHVTRRQPNPRYRNYIIPDRTCLSW
jgi:hypothetical protein